MLVNNNIYQSELGSIKRSSARGKFSLKAKTSGFALKYVVSGSEIYSINNKIYTLEKKQFIILRNGEEFEAKEKASEKETVGICIDLCDILSEEQFQLIDNNPLLFHTTYECPVSTAVGQHLFSLQSKNNTNVKLSDGATLLTNFTNYLHLFSEELSHLGNHLSTQVKKLETQKFLLSRLIATKDFIHTNFNKKIKLDQLARHAGISKYHLLRLFKHCYQQSPLELQKEIRMQKVDALMLQQNLRLIDIAHLLGYTDLAAFSNQFKKRYGVTPNKYRSNLN